MKFGRDVDRLRTVGRTLVTTDAVACLTQTGDGAVIAYEESPARLAVFVAVVSLGDIALIDTLVVVQEYGRDVQSPMP